MGWLRIPRTTQERRANGKRSNYINVDGYKIKTRARRSQCNLPCHWDDLIRKDEDDRTWKRHRRTQYKVVEWVGNSVRSLFFVRIVIEKSMMMSWKTVEQHSVNGSTTP